MELATNKSLTEVYEVLKHLSQIEYNKIPKDAIDVIVQNKDNNYKWTYNESKSLSEQGLSREAVAILSFINLEPLTCNAPLLETYLVASVSHNTFSP